MAKNQAFHDWNRWNTWCHPKLVWQLAIHVRGLTTLHFLETEILKFADNLKIALLKKLNE